MKQIAIKIFLIMLSSALLAFHAQAKDCDPKQPSFTVDGVEKWGQKTAVSIFEESSKSTLTKNEHIEIQGIPIKTLIAPYGQQGSLTISTCDNTSLNIDVQKILTESPEYYLILARRDFFKLVLGSNPKPRLKQISSLQLNTK